MFGPCRKDLKSSVYGVVLYIHYERCASIKSIELLKNMTRYVKSDLLSQKLLPSELKGKMINSSSRLAINLEQFSFLTIINPKGTQMLELSYMR